MERDVGHQSGNADKNDELRFFFGRSGRYRVARKPRYARGGRTAARPLPSAQADDMSIRPRVAGVFFCARVTVEDKGDNQWEDLATARGREVFYRARVCTTTPVRP